MSVADEITKAVGAHGMWKNRLVNAIATGKCEIPAAQAKQDNQCEFGKWLYGSTLTIQDKANPGYAKVKDLHAKFHGCAGRALECVAANDKAGAQKLLDSDFTSISSELTRAMMEWKKNAA